MCVVTTPKDRDSVLNKLNKEVFTASDFASLILNESDENDGMIAVTMQGEFGCSYSWVSMMECQDEVDKLRLQVGALAIKVATLNLEDAEWDCIVDVVPEILEPCDKSNIVELLDDNF
jgi:hypothetical protein